MYESKYNLSYKTNVHVFKLYNLPLGLNTYRCYGSNNSNI